MATTSPSVSLSGSTIIYTEQTSVVTTPARQYPVLSVYSKTGSQAPVLLASIGKSGEEIEELSLTPDHKSIIIDLESKLQRLDIATKKLTDLATAKESFYSNVAFSPNGNQLIAWD